jgi:hypothetical protein
VERNGAAVRYIEPDLGGKGKTYLKITSIATQLSHLYKRENCKNIRKLYFFKKETFWASLLQFILQGK